MITRYQLIMIGAADAYSQQVKDTFFNRVSELGIDVDKITIIEAADFSVYEPAAPAFCIYFGSPTGVFRNLDIVKRLQSDGRLILPLVDYLTRFAAQIQRVWQACYRSLLTIIELARMLHIFNSV